MAHANPATTVSRNFRRDLEDLAGRTFMLLWFTLAAISQGRHLINLFQSDRSLIWLLDVANAMLLIGFSTLSVALTVLRRPSKVVAAGLEPRISAILGSFFILSLALLPAGDPGFGMKVVALPITMIGAGLSLYCLFWLGQSYSIMATARKLVMGGPYRFVRHPLYAAELLTILGITLANFSLPAVLIFLATIGFQLRRSVNEERVLRAAFPEYDEYARRVPRIIPPMPKSRSVAVPSGRQRSDAVALSNDRACPGFGH